MGCQSSQLVSKMCHFCICDLDIHAFLHQRVSPLTCESKGEAGSYRVLELFTQKSLQCLMSGVPSLRDLMPDDLRWSWCNNNRNKVHNKCNVLESSPSHPPSLVCGKVIFYETQPLVLERLGTTVMWFPTIPSSSVILRGDPVDFCFVLFLSCHAWLRWCSAQ